MPGKGGSAARVVVRSCIANSCLLTPRLCTALGPDTGHRSRRRWPCGPLGDDGSRCPVQKGRSALVAAETTAETGDQEARLEVSHDDDGHGRPDRWSGRSWSTSTRSWPPASAACMTSPPTSLGSRPTRCRRGWRGSSAGSTRRSAPHMAWEESWLYPQIDDRAQTPWATSLVRFDHRQILEQAEHLHAHATRDGHEPAARGDDAGRRSRGPRGIDARQHRARGAIPVSRCWIARQIDGHPSGGTDRGRERASGRRTSRGGSAPGASWRTPTCPTGRGRRS